jgi:NADPH:quinone reductase-like Zn-dependent oxidoreductase
VRSIGADPVIDYAQEDFTQNEGTYDLIFDIVANRPVSDYMRALTPMGSYVACAFNPTSLILGPLISKSDGKKAISLVHKPRLEDLVFMGELLETGAVTPVIDRRYPLAELPEAVRYVESKRHRGKVVIVMDQ